MHALRFVRSAKGSVYEPLAHAERWPRAHQCPSGQGWHWDALASPVRSLYKPSGQVRKVTFRLEAAGAAQ